MTGARITFCFILPCVQVIGVGRISIVDYGGKMVCVCVENQETKFPGLISPEFEFV